MITGKFKKLKDFVLDLIFPRECLGCGRINTYLCRQCFNQIDLNNNFYCALCKKPSPLAKICANCQTTTPIRAIWVAANYNNKVLQDLIHYLKYNYIEAISADLARLMANYLKTGNILDQLQLKADNTILVPIPLHKKRFLQRGFNQSELLANCLSSYFGFEQVNLIVREKNTQSQINLKRNERQENVKSAFSLVNNWVFDKNKKIILVDDVVTTGSTLNECAKVLEKAGCLEIYGLVAAQRED